MNDILTTLAALTQKDENGLLPCQCGGSAKIKESYNNAHLLNMRCKKCGLIISVRRDEAIAKWNNRPREAALIALVQEAAAEIERLRGLVSVIRMKAEWRFQGSDFVAEEDPAYGKVSEAAIAATAFLREILTIANKAINPQEAS